MMTQENQPLRVSGSKVDSDTQRDSNATNSVQHMRHELAAKHIENHKLTDQLNCLVSLIKRSWAGDSLATLHLSNIVGMEPPQYLDVREERAIHPSLLLYPSPLAKTRWEKNWERLTIKLLNREYLSVQQEIRDYQQQYIENRHAYMDAVLQDHRQKMSRISLQHNSDSYVAMDEMNLQYYQYSKVTNEELSTSSCKTKCYRQKLPHQECVTALTTDSSKPFQRIGPGARGNFSLVQSAGRQRKVPVNKADEKMEVSLYDLIGEGRSSGHHFADQTLNQPQRPSANAYRRPLSSVLPRHLPPNTYNDSGRYTQGSLFALNESDGVKRPRPVSSTSLKAGDIIRSRPRSGRYAYKNSGEQTGKPTYTSQKGERPLKYETTHPVSSKPKSAKRRGSSADGAYERAAGDVKPLPVLLTDIISASSKAVMSTAVINSSGNDLDSSRKRIEHFSENGNMEDSTSHHDKNDEEVQDCDAGISAKPPVAVRVKSTFQRRPAFIDEYAKDEQAIRDIQEDFRKTALSLQKKLGIGDSGIVTYDY